MTSSAEALEGAVWWRISAATISWLSGTGLLYCKVGWHEVVRYGGSATSEGRVPNMSLAASLVALGYQVASLSGPVSILDQGHHRDAQFWQLLKGR